MASPYTQFVVSLGVDGRIASQGEVADALSNNQDLNIEAEDAGAVAKVKEENNEQKPEDKVTKGDGKLTVAEEIQEGHVSWNALKLFFVGLGGNHSLLFWTIFLLGMFLTDFTNTVQTWWLGYWARQYDMHDASDVAVPLSVM